MYRALVGIVGSIDDLISDHVSTPAESVQQVRQSPRIVSKEKNLLPPSAHYKRAWIKKNTESALPGDSGSKSSAQRRDLEIKVFSLLLSHALRTRNDFFYNLRQDLDDETLSAKMWEHLPVIFEQLNIRSSIGEDYDMAMDGQTSSRYWMRRSNIDRMIGNAINSSAEKWNAEWVPRHREQASRGGKNYKAYTLADHVNTAHMSVTEAHRALGIARGTVYAMRREFADIDLTTGEVHDDTTPTSQPVPALADRVGAEAGDADGSGFGGMVVDDEAGGSTQDLDASRSPAVAEGSRRILRDIYSLTLPF